MRRRRRPFAPILDRLESIELLSGSTLPAGFSPAQIAMAYGLNSVSFSSGGKTVAANGSGQTIAIVDAFHDPDLQSDLNTFDAKFGLPNTTVKVTAQTSTTNDGWAGEETLDVEWVHAIAPGATIDVVEAKSDNLTDLLNAVNTARNIAGVSVVSMSWGGGEFFGENSDDSFFTTPTGHTPITSIAATGDSSAFGGAEWPASSPNVLAVGGTTLNTTSTGAFLSESAWSDGGGGYSQVEAEPTYQAKVQTSGARTTPDVSLNANPNTGYAVYTTTPSNGKGSWQVVGGTSASTQIWAGIVAIADQGRVLAGGTTLNGATQLLPTLYSLSSNNFHDISSGSNGYAATKGYDLATGLGSPVLNVLIPSRVSSTTTVPVGTTTARRHHDNRRRLRWPPSWGRRLRWIWRLWRRVLRRVPVHRFGRHPDLKWRRADRYVLDPGSGRPALTGRPHGHADEHGIIQRFQRHARGAAAIGSGASDDTPGNGTNWG